MPVVEILIGSIAGIGVGFLILGLWNPGISDYMSDSGYSRGDRRDQHKKELD